MAVVDIGWYYSLEYKEPCQVIEIQTLWGETVCRVWLPDRDTVVQVSAADLQPLATAGLETPDGLIYRAAAARIAEAFAQDILLAPLEASVIPLPHQIQALSRAVSGDRVRYLLADEVGLGKTIEAGLILRELKLRNLVRRTLVVAPKGLVTQWVAEIATHFNETFRPMLSEDYRSLKRLAAVLPPEKTALPGRNPFQAFDQIVVSMDSVKPPADPRSLAWERFQDLIGAGWDLIIVDEAHRLGGSTDQVARYQLGQALAEAAPYLLLLSATPHQGKSDHFRRLMSLLDPQAFPDEVSISRERVRPYVIRTEKRLAVDPDGKPLFKPRRTELAPVAWQARHGDQQRLYQAVTEYVREGYNRALQEKRHTIGFLMLLMQRLVVSSTRAIRTTLARRLEALGGPETGAIPDRPEVDLEALSDSWDPDTFYELDGEEQVGWFVRAHLPAIWDERTEVQWLLALARECERQGPDAKAEALLDWIYRLQAEEGDPALKVLVFTEFVPTQEMLYEFLTARGFQVVCLNGSMSMEERRQAQQAFADEARILISTDAGGEGLNLQFCHVVINYDIPWNPMRLEQRIGRVDRIGQSHVVRAVNFVFADSVEHRVLEVLEEKLRIILQEFGIDKTGDVLDSVQGGQIFDGLYVEALLRPEALEAKAEEVVQELQTQAQILREKVSVLAAGEPPDPHQARRLLSHPFPYWVERMTIGYLRAHGGRAERRDGAWDLIWPDGEHMSQVVFNGREAGQRPLSVHLTLEHPRVRELLDHVPLWPPDQPIPAAILPGLPPTVRGIWSLWRVSAVTPDGGSHRYLPVFVAENGRVFVPTARHIWESLLTGSPTLTGFLASDESRRLFERSRKAAEEQGQTLYMELVRAHQARLAREKGRRAYAFAARRRAIQRLGLPQVRAHRLRLLEQEEAQFAAWLESRAPVLPQLTPIALMYVDGKAAGEQG